MRRQDREALERERAREQGRGGGPISQRILRYLRNRGGKITAADVEREMDDVQATVAGLALDRLYKDELVQREELDDTRGKLTYAYYVAE